MTTKNQNNLYPKSCNYGCNCTFTSVTKKVRRSSFYNTILSHHLTMLYISSESPIPCYHQNLSQKIFDISLTAIAISFTIISSTMCFYKQHGIMPNQYHYFYDQGDTIIYYEHITDSDNNR